MKQAFAVKDQAILDAAELVLDEIKAIGADEGETWVSRNVLTELYYELGKISMVRTVFSDKVSVKLLKDKRKGTVNLNSFDPVDIKQAVADAWQSAGAAEPDEAEGIAELHENLSFSAGDEQPDLDKMYGQLVDMIADTNRDFPLISYDSIGIEHNHNEKLYANTNGVRLSDEVGLYQLSNMFIARDGERASSFNYFGTVYKDPSERVLESDRVRRILDETQRQVETEQFEGSFMGDLVIMPGCLENFLWYIGDTYLQDGALISGTSPWKEKLGEQIASPLVNFELIAEHPELPAASNLSGDGYVAENMPLIEDGVLKNFSLSRYGAAKTGLKRSANSVGTFVFGNGDTPLEELIAGVEKGILLGRFSGGQPSPSGDLSGVAKNSFLIENGKVTNPLSEVMIAGNLGDMLRDTVAVSRERENSGYWLLPWVRVKNVTISGK
ncbi:MAG: TldD/PmbA family protein [Anaerolineaceae bacterium]|jgi:PmbA protein|nr:TldD/PmbA family protein [Anaerolineaceae bacterium]MDD4042693.1 TldD/PmbA family protein [Anaerolineaceae bacterium]MDD4577098.1 TldD/PmbA family protein [Anaerolineaceae bacterium]